MKTRTLPDNSLTDSGKIMQRMSEQLARVIAINLICLAVFIALCALMTFGSLSLLVAFWNEHRAASMIVMMIAIVSIPSVIELTVSRLGFWQR